MALTFREATSADVPQIVALLADDPLGQSREGGQMAPYLAAFEAIRASGLQWLIVGYDSAGEGQGEAAPILATYQLCILDGLSRNGARRALVEAVRVAASHRSKGYGALLMQDCETRARAAGAVLLQLTTDKSRLRAHAFYERLGFQPSHIGYKKPL